MRLLIIICRSEERVIFKGQKVKRREEPSEQGWDTLGQLPASTYQCVLLFSYINNDPEEVQNKY